MTTDFPVVGIGASAGGVEALEAFFAAMPAENGMAFVVVMHLDPTHASWLADIISRRTSMPVITIRDGEAIEPGRVYVLPPGAIVSISEGRLHLRERGAGERAPIDIFFNSLAEDCGNNAVGIVLSGSGSDGTLGIKAIKGHGGLTLAQGSNRTEPRFKDMPESATATGLVDVVVPVEQIPERLLAFLRNETAVESERIAAAMGKIYEILQGRLGHDFSEYKDKTFGRRLQRRMQALQLINIDAYVHRLQHDPDEAPRLFRDLLIGVTAFFRDPDAFQALKTVVIPKVFEGKDSGNDVRVWVPGCSTGEEAYTVAILLREHMETLPSAPKVQLFGTDIDDRALAVARAGQYPQSLLDNVSPERLKRFFVPDGHAYRLVREIRDLCIFSPHSMLRDPPFSRLDLISCRNLLIYLNTDLQARVIPIFHYALKPDGYLFLGLSETVTRHGDLFAPVDKQCRIYKRRDLVKPALNMAPQFAAHVRRPHWSAPSPHASGALMPNILRSASAVVMEHFAPAHVVVNADGDVLHYSIKTGRYLEPAFGSPSRDLLAMARKGLRLDLRAALRKAVETHQTVTNDHVSVEVNGAGIQTVSLTVQPITEGDETVFLVVFTDVGPVRPSGEVAESVPAAGTIEQVDRELRETKQRLQATIEELETSNEELKSSNEEMLSVNEELQSSNEELEASKEETQSINEELQTVNSELHRKVAELDQSNSDLRNIFESTQVATVFLDRALVIRSFTSAATGIFNLIPSDVGRPLGDIASRLDTRSLDRDLREVLAREQVVERRVTANDGTSHYLMRLLPYRALSRSIEGVLVTFTDVTSVVASEEHQKMLTAELSHRIKNTLAVIASIATQTGARAQSIEAFLETFLGRVQSLAGTHTLLSEGQWADVGLRGLIERELAPYAKADGRRLEMSGPPMLLKPRAAIAFGMVLHELATNSVKYGALSVPKGRLQVSWDAPRRSVPQRLELRWIESGGPAASAPIKRGFGLEFIERAMQFELHGAAEIAFEKTGLQCTIGVPLGPDVVPSAPATTGGGS
jgi:two-component system CheB/CheR fusion protein